MLQANFSEFEGNPHHLSIPDTSHDRNSAHDPAISDRTKILSNTETFGSQEAEKTNYQLVFSNSDDAFGGSNSDSVLDNFVLEVEERKIFVFNADQERIDIKNRIAVPQLVTKQFLRNIINSEEVSIDAEWVSEQLEEPKYEKNNLVNNVYKKANFLSVQLTFYNQEGLHIGIILWNENFPLPPEDMTVEGVDVQYICLCNLRNESAYSLGLFRPGLDYKIYMFYSPKDAQAILGDEFWKVFLSPEDFEDDDSVSIEVPKKIEKKRRITGKAKSGQTTFTLVDLIGVFNCSLDNALKSVGIDNPHKSLATDKGRSKDRMDLFMLDDPADNLRYAMADAIYLRLSFELKKNQTTGIVKDSLDLDPLYVLPEGYDLLTSDDKKDITLNYYPMSSGALVNDVFIKWLHHSHRDLVDALLPLTRIPDREISKRFEESVLVDRYSHKCSGKLGKKSKYKPKEPLESGHYQDQDSYFHPLSINSIPSQVVEHSGTTGVLNALVFGGRCVNENPTRTRAEYVIDPDMQSCYGSALRSFILPLGGQPRKIVYDPQNSERMTLGQFLEKNEADLVPDTWQVYLSGELSFEQDLLFSKLGTSPNKIESVIRTVITAKEDEERTSEEETHEFDKVHVPAEMKLVRKELRYAVLTSHSLDIIKNVCSEKEWKEIKSLKIDTALWYSKKDQVSEAEMIAIANKYNTLRLAFDEDGVTPIRPYEWYSLPLDEFIGKFIDTRKGYKKKSKDKSLDKSVREEYDQLQNGVKLFINTLYGCLASPFFPIGNTVTANNITSKARCGVWMMAKALGSHQSITDGGMFSVNQVRFLEPHRKEGKRPSMNVLANYDRVNKYRNIRTGSLFDVNDWQNVKRTIWANDGRYNPDNLHPINIDTIVLNHVNEFWKHYGLSMPFAIECKYENTGDFAGYDGSADYMIVGTAKGERIEGIEGNVIIKCRGTKSGHVKHYHLRDLAIGRYTHVLEDGVIVQRYTDTFKQIGVKQYQANGKAYKEQNVMPGDEELFRQFFRPNTNHFPVMTVEEWELKKRAYSRLVRIHQKDGFIPFGYTATRQSDLRLNQLLKSNGQNN